MAMVPAGAAAQHAGHGGDTATVLPPMLMAGFHAVPLITRATPTAGRRSLTEAYLSQVAVLGMAAAAGGRVEAMAMLNLEGLTLERGELTTGAYGEGYVDRRHPHAYLHEVIATVRTRPAARRARSLSAGRGFATFGSDDPMVRPFAKYPVNHHLAQVLERALIAGAVRVGFVAVDASIFNGDEPTHASDLPALDRVGDSWSARLTLYPVQGVELSLSHASVESPEVQAGFGADAQKWHAGARIEVGRWYGLAEWARSTDEDDGRQGQSFESMLAEAAVEGRLGVGAIRVERTDRHEEERLDDPFRTPPSSGGAHVLGVTRWTTVTVAASGRFEVEGGAEFRPFVEVAAARPSVRTGIIFDPRSFYGARTLAMVSAGIRLTAGSWHARMGRYGVAAVTLPEHH